jgi:hypothetical protein
MHLARSIRQDRTGSPRAAVTQCTSRAAIQERIAWYWQPSCFLPYHSLLFLDEADIAVRLPIFSLGAHFHLQRPSPTLNGQPIESL